MCIDKIKTIIKIFFAKTMFKHDNPNNGLYLNDIHGMVNPRKIHCGKYSYGPLNIYSFSSNDGELLIGNYCSIADEVVFLTGGGHRYTSFLSFPVQRKLLAGDHESISKGDIIVEDDVWIGFGATILSGVKLHKGCVVGAKAVITKDVPPYAIVVGSPARIIKFRFEEEIINELLKIDFSKLSLDQLKEIYKYENVSNNIQQIERILSEDIYE